MKSSSFSDGETLRISSIPSIKVAASLLCPSEERDRCKRLKLVNVGQTGPAPQKSQGNASEKSSKKRVNYHVKSLREIRRAQKSVGLLIPRLPFMRVVKQIIANLCSLMKTTSFINVKWQTQALLCLQEAAEDFAIDVMNDAYLCDAHSHRVTLMAKDYYIYMQLIDRGH
ncbi:hypothetical protein KP509_02G100900 [Ceratopteris richardii]|uniref:Core Histone H2A/H2B/H3 domain-containing protein n=1 Tax=Ceratopteris richardii TaxID=49495 RepID=A0A8T2VHD1_CERRI|nr:hypothetical protein KP509_02G100900 [Ceratopteris richardii]